jgi:hypothetical protein
MPGTVTGIIDTYIDDPESGGSKRKKPRMDANKREFAESWDSPAG